MKEIAKIEKKLLEHLHNLYINQNICTVEIINFLDEYKDWILLQNKINPDKHKIIIHYGSKDIQDEEAYIDTTKASKIHNVHFHNLSGYGEKYDKDIQRKVKNIDTKINKGLTKNNYFFANNVFNYFIYLLADAGHEYKHIIQYIQSNELIEQEDIMLQDIELDQGIDFSHIIGKKKDKQFKKALYSYLDNIDNFLPSEIEADDYSLTIGKYLLDLAISDTNDNAYIDFLLKAENLLTMDIKNKKIYAKTLNKSFNYNDKKLTKIYREIDFKDDL